MSPRFHSFIMKAPAPTGLEPKSAPFSVTAFCGTTEAENMASVERNGADGSFSVMKKVMESGM